MAKISRKKIALIFGITGANGRVGLGGLEILDFLPNKKVTMEELDHILETKDDPIH